MIIAPRERRAAETFEEQHCEYLEAYAKGRKPKKAKKVKKAKAAAAAPKAAKKAPAKNIPSGERLEQAAPNATAEASPEEAEKRAPARKKAAPRKKSISPQDVAAMSQEKRLQYVCNADAGLTRKQNETARKIVDKGMNTHKWQFHDRTSRWRWTDYAPAVSVEVERMNGNWVVNPHVEMRYVKSGTSEFMVDFNSMQQHEISNYYRIHNIQRIPRNDPLTTVVRADVVMKTHRPEARQPVAVARGGFSLVRRASTTPVLTRLPSDVLGIVFAALGAPRDQAALRTVCRHTLQAFDNAVRNERFIAVAGSNDREARWDTTGVRWYPVNVATARRHSAAGKWPPTLVVSLASMPCALAIGNQLGVPDFRVGDEMQRFGRVQVLCSSLPALGAQPRRKRAVSRCSLPGDGLSRTCPLRRCVLIWAGWVRVLEIIHPEHLFDDGWLGNMAPGTACEHFTVEFMGEVQYDLGKYHRVDCPQTIEQVVSKISSQYEDEQDFDALYFGGNLVVTRYVDLRVQDGQRVLLISTLDLLDRDPTLELGTAARHPAGLHVRDYLEREEVIEHALVRMERKTRKPTTNLYHALHLFSVTEGISSSEHLEEDEFPPQAHVDTDPGVLEECSIDCGLLSAGPRGEAVYVELELDKAAILEWGRNCFTAEFNRYDVRRDDGGSVRLKPAEGDSIRLFCDHYDRCETEKFKVFVGHEEYTGVHHPMPGGDPACDHVNEECADSERFANDFFDDIEYDWEDREGNRYRRISFMSGRMRTQRYCKNCKEWYCMRDSCSSSSIDSEDYTDYEEW